jgi:hypothetical protein
MNVSPYTYIYIHSWPTVIGLIELTELIFFLFYFTFIYCFVFDLCVFYSFLIFLVLTLQLAYGILSR